MENRNKQNEVKEMPIINADLIARIVGLFLVFYGFLALTQPNKYSLGIPTEYTPLLALFLIIGGIIIIMQRRRVDL